MGWAGLARPQRSCASAPALSPTRTSWRAPHRWAWSRATTVPHSSAACCVVIQGGHGSSIAPAGPQDPTAYEVCWPVVRPMRAASTNTVHVGCTAPPSLGGYRGAGVHSPTLSQQLNDVLCPHTPPPPTAAQWFFASPSSCTSQTGYTYPSPPAPHTHDSTTSTKRSDKPHFASEPGHGLVANYAYTRGGGGVRGPQKGLCA